MSRGRGSGDARRRWSELSRTQRGLIIAAGTVEAVLKIAMLVDLRRRPAEQVRGRKGWWAATALVNSAGVLQIAYFVRGRRSR